MALLEAVMAQPPESMRALADRLGRAADDIHDELYLLAGDDNTHLEADGRAKQPYVPDETVRIGVEFGLWPEDGSGPAASASAAARARLRSTLNGIETAANDGRDVEGRLTAGV